MKITIAGTGYVGLSLAILLSRFNDVYALDIDEKKVKMINDKISPLDDEEIKKYLLEEKLNLKATIDYKEALKESDFIIICTPTNYDEKKNYFDTSSVEDIIEKTIKYNKNGYIVIKSTIPVGFVESMKKKYNISNIFFSPEFLREGKALYDNLYPSRIVVGDKSAIGTKFANLLKQAALKKDIEIKYMNSTEAEAVKLFANTYLAMRTSFFNELDTYAELNNLNSKDIIDGMCLDPRIGNYYNNPSFGYGGYCMPKDTKQLLANYKNVPENLISAIVESNMTRKKHIFKIIKEKKAKTIGIYRLTMKANSDNYRFSSIQDIIKMLRDANLNLLIYEPTFHDEYFDKVKVENDLDKFKENCDLIVANRIDEKINDSLDKIYTRDIYNNN